MRILPLVIKTDINWKARYNGEGFMVRRLQIKFIIITLLATIVISGCVFWLIISENYRTINDQSEAVIRLIAENEGQIPEYNEDTSSYITKETRFSTRYFTIEISESGEIANKNMKHIAMVTEKDAKNMAESIEGENGYYNNFKYRVISKDGSKLYIFLDCTMQLKSLRRSTLRSFNIIVCGWITVGIIVALMSRRLLRPITQNIEKQKQFITNASHELKTPLAVITADIDVLEMTVGEENEWLHSIKSQTNRLNTLIKSLLSLANVEEGDNRLELSEFSINDVIQEEINDFKPLLQDKHIEHINNYNSTVKADINMTKQLIVILLDNAIKYTPDDGQIKICVDKQGKNVKVEVCNSCENVENININRVFERFYRDDKSRNKKKEGYGIGLSIAKSIVNAQKWKIGAYIDNDKMVCFRVIIPNK